jgi:hypothetical protein
MTRPGFIPYCPTRLDQQEMRARALATYQTLDARRSVRDFSD